MQILHIIGSMDPVSGGPCQGIRNLNKALEAKGILREVVTVDNPTASFLSSDPFIIHALGPGKSPWQYSSNLFPWLIENLIRFDVIIVNGVWLYHAYAATKALQIIKRRQIKFKNDLNQIPRLFIMPHGMLDPYFQNARGRKLKAFRNWAYWRLIEGRNIALANGLLFTSEEELRLARQTFKPYQPKKEYNIGYGIPEPPTFSLVMQQAFDALMPYLKDRPFLLFLGRIHQKKGVDLLIKAYKEVYFNMKRANERELIIPALLIAGPGLETKYGRKIQELVSELGITEAVFFPGMLSGNAKWAAFYCCEAFVLPSHQENFGIAIVEALACSRPVLISKQVNIWREIDKYNGGFVAQDDLAGTTQILNKWADAKIKDRAEMQENARNCYQENFAIEPAAMRLVNAISSPSQLVDS